MFNNLGGVLESEVTRSYNSLSGSDIRAVIGYQQFAEIQAISYSVTREKAPIYTMGSPDPRSFSRNKRGCAGSLIWISFDRHALLNLFRRARGCPLRPTSLGAGPGAAPREDPLGPRASAPASPAAPCRAPSGPRASGRPSGAGLGLGFSLGGRARFTQ
jgi:hypothetical protein